MILAGGGVVVRRQAGRPPEYAVVHRPRYDDWSLPKGKVDPGETAADAARREVEEETGVRCGTGVELGSVSYPLSTGQRKVVRYWLLEARAAGSFQPSPEVDEVLWLERDEACARVSYPRDRAVLEWGDALAERPDRGTVYLVRHAHAGRRGKWEGPDQERPVQGKGWKQVTALTETLAGLPVTRVLTSPFVRCRQTVAAAAEAAELKLEDEEALTEGTPPEAVARLLAELAGAAAVLCSHGDVISDLVGRAAAEGATLAGGLQWEKGSVWVLGTEHGTVRTGRYLPPV